MIKYNFYKCSIAFLIAAILLTSCQTHFDLLKANRAQYSIDNHVAVDSTLIRTYLPYKQKMDAQMSAIIGKTDSLLFKGRGAESTLGNFFADACITEAKKINPNIDFAIPSTNGGLRNSLPEGNIALSNVFELMPFENELLILKLKGSDVQELIRYIASTGGQPVSGITLTIKDKTAKDILINGKPFDSNKTYNILTSDYIAGGGDEVFGLKNPIEKEVIGLKVRDALIQYIKGQTAAGKTINGKLDGRIIKD